MHRSFFCLVTLSVAVLLSLVADAGRWPTEYRRLRCIHSNGQIIRTGVVPNGKVPVVELQYISDEQLDATKYVFGYWSNPQQIGTAIGQNGGKFWLRVGDTAGGGYGTMSSGWHTIRLNAEDGTSVDGRIAHSNLANLADDGIQEYYLLGRVVRDYGDRPLLLEPAKCTLYYAKIWLNGEMKRNYVPCQSQLTGEVGLYETVEGRFCTGELASVKMYGYEVERAYQVSDIDPILVS